MPYKLVENDPIGQQESALEFIGRTGARSAARGAESILGLPGDVIGGVLGLANAGIGAVTGKESPLPSKLLVPTSEDIRTYVTKPLTGEYLEPRGSWEKFADDIVGDAATIFMPAKGKIPFGKAVLGAFGRSAVGNTSKWAAEEVTGSPLIGGAAKIGSMALAGTFGGRKELGKIKNKSYEDAFSKVPPKTSFDITPEKNKLDKLLNSIKRGDKPEKDFLVGRLESINNIAKHPDKAQIREIIDLKQDWNKHLSDPKLSSASRSILGKSVGILNEGIGRYGASNPEFFEPYKIGEELTGALKSTNYFQKMLNKHPYIQESVKNPVVKALFYFGSGAGAKEVGLQGALGIGAAALGAKESAKMYQLLFKSPFARRYYKGAIEAALKNDSSALLKNMVGLDKAADRINVPTKKPEKGSPTVAEVKTQAKEPARKAGRYKMLD